MRTRLAGRGFTLIEMMIVLAIVGIVSALAVSSYQGIGVRMAPQNAAADLSSAFSKARARATEKNANVWMVVFPQAGHDGVTGKGAWVIYEDLGLTFNITTATSPESIVDTGTSKVIDRKFLDDYPGKNVQFNLPLANTAADQNAIGAPFAARTTSAIRGDFSSTFGCAFCGGSGAAMRGAILFTSEGAARFYQADGTVAGVNPGVVVVTDSTASSRSFIFAVSRATSFVTVFQN